MDRLVQTALLAVPPSLDACLVLHIGLRGALGLDRFGASAPGSIVAEKLGLHVKGIVEQVLKNTLQ